MQEVATKPAFFRDEFGAESVEIGHVIAKKEVVCAVVPFHVIETRDAEVTVGATQLATSARNERNRT